MKRTGFRGADALVDSLIRAGTTKVFTLSGNHVLSVFDAIFDANGIDLIHTRHEAAAVHMADAYARMTGQPGVALVSAGPGHANALSALYTAAMANSPVVLLSGHAPLSQVGMGAFQEVDQVRMASPVAKAAWVSQRPEDVFTDLAQAVRIARDGRPGPVNLQLPSDVLECSTGRAPASDTDVTSGSDLRVSEDALRESLERLKRARCPLVLAGPMLLSKAGRHQINGLQEAMGIPVIGMESPRGIGDPSLGAFKELIGQADCVLLLAKRLDFTVGFGRPPVFQEGCKFIQFDPDVKEEAHSAKLLGSRLTLFARMDPFAATGALRELAARKQPSHRVWTAEVLEAIAIRPDGWSDPRSNLDGCMHPLQALRPLQNLLDSHDDSVFISDGGEFGQWAQASLRAPNRVTNGVAGAIGGALPFAIGARIAKPDAPVVAVSGDGAFGFHVAEIDTAVRYGLPLVAVIGNDSRWNAEYQIQTREFGGQRAIGCDLLPTRYDQVTIAFGGYGELVSDPDDVLSAAWRALHSNAPACINVMIDGRPAPTFRRSYIACESATDADS